MPKKSNKLPAGTSALPQAPAEPLVSSDASGARPGEKDTTMAMDLRPRPLKDAAASDEAKLLRVDPLNPQPRNSLSLYQIERELDELLQLREDLNDGVTVPLEEREAVDKQIADYIGRELRKVDGIAHAIRVYGVAQRAAHDEASRLEAREAALANRVAYLMRATTAVMQQHGIKRLETATNVIRIQANGGVQPLEVSEGLKPEEFHDVTITVSLDLWIAMLAAINHATLDPEHQQELDQTRRVFSLNGNRARAALAEKVVCKDCSGAECEKCGGSGTVARTIPGVKLLPRGVHLRVE